MNAIYISVEKNIEVFDLYKKLWSRRGVTGIMVSSMTEGIKTAITIEKSGNQYLYFVDIVADDINYMPQLADFNNVIEAPILIATSNYNEDECHKALATGAHSYGTYCYDPKKNIKAVISSVISYHRARKKKSVSDILSCGEVFISLSQRRAYVKDSEVELTKIEFDMLQYFVSECGRVLSYEQIYDTVWNEEFNESSKKAIKTMIKKLRKKITGDENENKIIENVRGFGYRMPI